MDWAARQAQMVDEQLVARGIRDPRVLKVMRETPRHLFIPEDLRARACEDRALPIGFDQTISQPYMVAWMLQALELKGDEKVLEIGTGSGYNAALLAQLTGFVHSIEIIPALAVRASQILRDLHITNVTVHTQDGSGGLPHEVPFSVIIVTAAAVTLPSPLPSQLTEGGRILLPLRVQNRHDALTLFKKEGATLQQTRLGDCSFVPLVGQYGAPA